MSVTSCAQVDRPGSPNDPELCCTEEELFESFMSIVNDPELQAQVNNEEGAGTDSSQSGKGMEYDDTVDESTLANEESEQNSCCNNGALDNNQVISQYENHTNETAAQHDFNDLNNHVQLSDSTGQNLSNVKNENKLNSQNSEDKKNQGDLGISETKQETVSQVDEDCNLQNEYVVSAMQNFELSSRDLKQTDQNKPAQLDSNLHENNQSELTGLSPNQQLDSQTRKEVGSSNLLRHSSRESKDLTPVEQPDNQSNTEVLLQQSTSPESGGTTLVEAPTNQSEGVDSTSPDEIGTNLSNQSEGDSLTNKSEGVDSLTNQSEGGVDSTNQSEGERVGITNQSQEAEASLTNQIDGEGNNLTNQSEEAEAGLTNQSEGDGDSLTNQSEGEGIDPTNQSEEKGVSMANQSEEAEAGLTNQGEEEDSLSNQSESKGADSTNQSEGKRVTNRSEETEAGLTNQSEGEGTSSISQSKRDSLTNHSELDVFENGLSIEERIRKAKQVCEELNAITQRLSKSSDELLGDNDSDLQQTEQTSLITEPGVGKELSQNHNILTSKQDESSTTHESQSDDMTQEEINSTFDRPKTLSKLVVNIQPGSPPPISPKPKLPTRKSSSSSPSPSTESSTVLLGISPTHITHLKDEPIDRKPSLSDSLDSSEGSLSGDAKSLGASPSPTQGCVPFNWEILNTALADDTDEEEHVYETSGNFGGFGLVIDEPSPDTIAADHSPDTIAADHSPDTIAVDHLPDTLSVEDIRYRSVSQSSTISEVEFQEQYRKKHSTASLERNIDGVLCSGYLFKLGGTGITPKNWRKRWCVLRHDRCLYYYKSARDKIPCGIVVLANYLVSHSSEWNKKNCIKISKGGGRTYFFSSDTPRDMLRWMEALRKAAENTDGETSFVIRKEIIHNVAIPALSIKKPDCHGYLTKQGAKSTRSWKRRYCVLKNGCLYYYREMADTTALGVAKLHGYTVDEIAVTGRKNGFRCVPPHSGMRTFTFTADNEYDKKRWIPCFRESIRANTSNDN